MNIARLNPNSSCRGQHNKILAGKDCPIPNAFNLVPNIGRGVQDVNVNVDDLRVVKSMYVKLQEVDITIGLHQTLLAPLAHCVRVWYDPPFNGDAT